MWVILSALISALLAYSRSEDTTVVRSRSCSFIGVFHVEGRERYSLKFDEAKSLCEHLASSLANLEQVGKAYEKGLQTCRNAWINSSEVVILRHNPNVNCAGNQIGIIRKIPDRKKYDALCFDAKDTSEKNCAARIDPDNLNKTDDSASTDTPNHLTAVTTHQTITEREGSGNSTSEDAFWSETSSPVYWTQSSPSQNHTDQTSMETDIEEFTTSHPHLDITELGVSETVSTSESPANKAGGNISSSSSIDWLVILLTILAVLLILLLCFICAKYRKRWCGKKKTLIITKESSSKENGAAASFPKEQEMVKLVNTEHISANNNSEIIEISSDK